MEEIWKDIIGYEGLYQISNLGRVKSLEKTVKVGKQYNRFPEKILSNKCLDKNGYNIFSANKDGLQKTLKVHREVAKCFIPNPENKPQVNHINGIKNDNRVENLEWCTNRENINHAYFNKLCVAAKGSKCGASKYKEDDILKIRKMAENGILHKDIAIMYKMSKKNVHNIINRKSWNHI